MGSCCSSREPGESNSIEQYQKMASDNLAKSVQQYNEFKEDQTKKYQERQLDAIGKHVSGVDDSSETCMITDFEEQLILRKVHLNDFERAIKKFAYKTNTVSLRQLTEAFKDNPQLEQCLEETCLDRKVLTHQFMMESNSPSYKKRKTTSPGRDDHEDEQDSNGHDQQNIYIPYLMLVGILYCYTSPRVRTEKFFQVLQTGLEPHISASDRELAEFLPRMCMIAFQLMVELYNDFQIQNGTESKAKTNWVQDTDNLQDAYQNVFDGEDVGFLDKLFGDNSKIASLEFSETLLKQHYTYLQPHQLRMMVFKNLEHQD